MKANGSMIAAALVAVGLLLGTGIVTRAQSGSSAASSPTALAATGSGQLPGDPAFAVTAALERLRSAANDKLVQEIDQTAIGFVDAENIARSLNVVYVLDAPLKIIEATVSMIGSLKDLTQLNGIFWSRDDTLGVLSITAALSSAQDVGENLQFVLDGPAYSSSVSAMLNEARTTQQPFAGYPGGPTFDGLPYGSVIKNTIWGLDGEDLVLVGDKFPCAPPRPGGSFAWCANPAIRGAMEYRRRINGLIDQAEAAVSSLGLDSSRATELTATIDGITMAVRQSAVGTTAASYSAYRPSYGGAWALAPVSVNLGEPASIEAMRREALARLDLGVVFEQTTTVVGAFGGVVGASLLTTSSLKLDESKVLKFIDRTLTTEGVGELVLSPVTKTFTVSARDAIVSLPAQMLLALPNELANLLVAVNDVKDLVTTRSDLAVVALTAPPTGISGGQIQISAKVANPGPGGAAPYRLGLYFSTDATITTGDRRVATCTMPALASGNSTTCSGVMTIPASLSLGPYYFGAFADDLAAVQEINEGNNTRSTPITINAPSGALPDLYVTDLVAPVTGISGGQIQVSATVANPGTGGAASYRLGLYFSTDATITTGDTRAATCTMPALASGNSTTCSGVMTIPTSLSPGPYYFGAFADDLAAVQESNDANNTKSTIVTISGAGNYTLSVSASPIGAGTVGGGGTFAAGSSRTVTATANSGYTFVNWTENGNVVSTAYSYTFTLNSSRILVGNFGPAAGSAPGFSISCALSPNPATLGQSVQGTILQSGGVLPISYKNGTASLGTSNTFTLTPVSTGTIGAAVSATDARGRTATNSCTGSVVAPTPRLSSITVNTQPKVNTNINVSLFGTGFVSGVQGYVCTSTSTSSCSASSTVYVSNTQISMNSVRSSTARTLYLRVMNPGSLWSEYVTMVVVN